MGGVGAFILSPTISTLPGQIYIYTIYSNSIDIQKFLLVLKGTDPYNGQVEDNIRLGIHMPLPADALVVIPPCMIFLVFFLKKN